MSVWTAECEVSLLEPDPLINSILTFPVAILPVTIPQEVPFVGRPQRPDSTTTRRSSHSENSVDLRGALAPP